MISRLQIQRRAPGSSAWRVLVWWNGVILILKLLLVVFYRFRSYGQENIPKTGALLFVGNHQSNFDPAIMGAAVYDRPFYGIARDTLFESKLLSILMKGFGVIAIRRGESDTKAIRRALQELEEGRCVMMFPEGTRTKDGQIAEFQRGFWLLMKKSKATVVPIGLDGAFDAYPVGSKPKLRGYIEACIGKPIRTAELLELGEEKGTAYVRSRIELLKTKCRESIEKRLS